MSCLSSFVKKKPTVSVIVLEGQIGRQKALSLKKTKEMIAKAFKKPNLVAVAMVINSGGGSPVQSQLIASYLLDWSLLFILILILLGVIITNGINILNICSGATPLDFPSMPLLRTVLMIIHSTLLLTFDF